MSKPILYLVGPRPLYPHNPAVRLDGSIIFETDSVGYQRAQARARNLSPALRESKQLSAVKVYEASIEKWLRRGATDLRRRRT